MTTFQEICVFFPCHTLEDFPTHLRDDEANGILAAWTAAWHPTLLSEVGQIPTWHRADTPPTELDKCLLLIPEAADSRLPSDLAQRAAAATDCQLLRVTGLEETTKQILRNFHAAGSDSRDLDVSADTSSGSGPDETGAGAFGTDVSGPALTVEDFHALGYAALQIQVMTRRLRYSSNLDLVTFGEHVIRAARAWGEQNLQEGREALQAAFDLLGEERDHYFSGDPHLIELLLVAPQTLGSQLLEELQGDAPLNLLMSGETAACIAEDHPDIARRITERITAGTLCVAGAAPDDETSLDCLAGSEVAEWLARGCAQTLEAFGSTPRVFGRIAGGIPGDLVQWLLPAGMIGAITNDFASGQGAQTEAKMIWQSSASELEALTAQPLAVTQTQSFLTLGAKLGESIDSGQVGAGLFVRWPGEDSPWLDALRRAGSFTPALGRLWRLDDFFVNGERPYHACTLPAARGDGQALTRQVTQRESNPLSATAKHFRHALRVETARRCEVLTQLLDGSASDTTAAGVTETGSEDWPRAAHRLAAALGMQVARTPQSDPGTRDAVSANSAVVINPHSGAARTQLELAGKPPEDKTPGLFASSRSGKHCRVTLDVPGPGFASLTCGQGGDGGGEKTGVFGFLKRKKPLAHGQSLSNEFLDVAIHPETGALAAVHAGAQRGNRFSWQLAYYDRQGPGEGYSQMVCDRMRVLESDLARGVIQTEGRLQVAERNVGQFVIRYLVERGSRWVDIEIEVESAAKWNGEPWQNYLAGRAAWSTSALSIRPIVRDKRHRSSGRRLESPMGVEVYEGDRKLLVCSYGLPAHRRIGGERLDTLLMVRGETERAFRLAYGFDVPAPVRALRQKLVPPVTVPLQSLSGDPARGWLVNLDSKRVVDVDWCAIDSNTLELTLVETTGKATKTKLQMFKDIATVERPYDQQSVEVEEGAAIVHLSAHEIVRLRVQLAS